MKFSDELRQALATLQDEMGRVIKDDASTAEEINALTAKIETTKTKLDAQIAMEALEQERMNGIAGTANLAAPSDDQHDVYEQAFYNAITGRALTDAQHNALTTVNNALSSASGQDGGYLIPVDQQVAIKELKRQYSSLEELVTVEPVSTLSGSRNIEKDAQYTPFAEFTEGKSVADSDTPQFVNIAYTIKDRGGILPIPHNLLADNQANLQAYLNRWLAKKQVATRNKLISDLLATKAKTTISDLDDVKDILNVTLDPAISAMSLVLMNQDSFNKLDKMKDNDGNYLLQIDPKSATQKLLCGKPVKVVSNRTIQTRVETSGSGESATSKKFAPVIIGSFRDAIVLFDRQEMSLLSTNIGGSSFEQNKTLIRAITREDVKIFDSAAFVFGEIEVQ